MTLEECLIRFARSTIDGVNAWYDWRVNPKYLPAGITLPQGNDYAQNAFLKLELSRLWRDRDVEGRLELARYYVAIWGGVRANKEETLSGYVTRAPEAIVAGGPTGVASWSKVLCIVDPHRYAIFDARVSTALNSLQVIHNVEEPELFPLLEGQNARINAGTRAFRQHSESNGWRPVPDAEFYTHYLGLMRRAGEHSGNPIHAIEMALFAQAEELLEEAFP